MNVVLVDAVAARMLLPNVRRMLFLVVFLYYVHDYKYNFVSNLSTRYGWICVHYKFTYYYFCYCYYSQHAEQELEGTASLTPQFTIL